MARRNGIYYKDGKEYVSVTKILQVINKPALVFWAANECTRIALAHPDWTEDEVKAQWQLKQGESKTRGKFVHSYIDIWAHGSSLEEAEKSLAEDYLNEYSGYIKAFKNFLTAFEPQTVASEVEVYSCHGYAGRLDYICKLGNQNWLLDFKTNDDGNIYKEVTLQLIAYKQACEEMGIEVHRMGVVALANDGSYVIKECTANIEQFLHAFELWKWQNGKNIKEVEIGKK